MLYYMHTQETLTLSLLANRACLLAYLLDSEFKKLLFYVIPQLYRKFVKKNGSISIFSHFLILEFLILENLDLN